MVISLDVIFHLVEDPVYDAYMRTLFCLDSGTMPDLIVVYSSNESFSVENVHTCNRVFTDWITHHAPDWVLVEKIGNLYPWDPASPDETAFADFYIFTSRHKLRPGRV